MRTLLSILVSLMLLTGAAIAEASAPTVFPLPDGHIGLACTPVGKDAEALLAAVAKEDENIVKLAIAEKKEDGAYHIVAMSGMIITLDNWDPDAVWMLDKWQDGRPYFWWGAGDVATTDEFYLLLERDADLGWMVANGFYAEGITGNTYHFTSVEPGFIQVSGETVSPAILWPTEASMQLEGFVLYEVDQACSAARVYLESFALTHTVDEQDDTYRIIW